MRTWFARHGPDAKRGTSYPEYLRQVDDNKPFRNKNKYRGAVSPYMG